LRKRTNNRSFTITSDDSTKPGKIVSVNADDADSDGVPDWADGYSRFSDTPILENSSSTQFVPLTLTLSSGVDLSTATIELDYEASDPLDCPDPIFVPTRSTDEHDVFTDQRINRFTRVD